MFPGGAKLSARPTYRVNVENEMIKRREREVQQQQLWGGRVEYYKTFENANNKFEAWTSPRYYDSSTKVWKDVRQSRDKQELLEKRREKLKKLFKEDEASYNIELIVTNRDHYLSPRDKATGNLTRRNPDDIPTELLKDVNLGIKLAEDDRRRHEAEIGLYHQWRNNNPTIRHHERNRNLKEMKLSWLDQQIQNRMKREQDEEECRRMIAERDKKLQRNKKKEEEFREEVARKNEELKKALDEQMKALKLKEKEGDELKWKEEEELKQRIKFLELEEIRREEEKTRKNREIALFNIKQHKWRLKQKAQDIRDNLRADRNVIETLLKYEVLEQVKDDQKKREMRETMTEFLKFAKDQETLENQRQKHFDSLFDSEFKAIFGKQNEIWMREQASRRQLLEDIMSSVKEQIEEKIQRNKEKQREVLKEREEMLSIVEKHDRDMRRLREEEVDKKIEFRKQIDEQIRGRARQKKELETLEQRNVDRELEKVRKEEDRLKNEIMRLQMRQGPSHRKMKSRLN